MDLELSPKYTIGGTTRARISTELFSVFHNTAASLCLKTGNLTRTIIKVYFDGQN